MLFSILLLVHVPVGLMCAVTGAVAMLSPKQAGRHPQAGTIYYWLLLVVFVSATGMSVLRWPDDAYLFVLGAISFLLGSIGYAARKRRWPGWPTLHAIGMSLSYILLLTAFYVDNGPRLPLWHRLPSIAFWIGPSVVGIPLLARTLARHGRMRSDLRAITRSTSLARLTQ